MHYSYSPLAKFFDLYMYVCLSLSVYHVGLCMSMWAIPDSNPSEVKSIGISFWSESDSTPFT